MLQDARESHNAGKLATASRNYAATALLKLIDTDFEAGRSTRLAGAYALCSVDCAARTPNRQLTVFLQSLTEAILQYAETGRPDDDCLAGLCTEWIGDSLLMVGEDGVEERYRAAREYYARSSDGERRSWGMEEEFDYATLAYEDFVEASGIDLGEFISELELEYGVQSVALLTFDQRIKLKLRVLSALRENG